MEVRLNDEIRTFSDNLTVAGVLEELGHDERRVRVKCNGEEVAEAQFAEVTVNHGDRVDIAKA